MSTGSNNTNVLGVFILARHGDKQGTFTSELSYTASNVQLTPLGQAQGYNLGARIQERYLKRTSASYVAGVNPDLYVDGQALIRADLGDESSMIFDTALAITQGIWPATNSNNITLGDGTYVISPLQGYQYVPIQTIDPNNNLYLDGWTDCVEYVQTAEGMDRLPDFLTKAQLNADFIQSLSTYVGGRPTSFDKIYDIWNYMNMRYVHDREYYASVPGRVIGQARDLANCHSLSPAVGGVIGAIIALVVAAAFLGLLALFGCVSFGRGASRKPPHRRNSSIPQIVVRMAKGKRDSADTESTIGIKANGAFEMMPDHISVLSRTPSIAPSAAHETKV
ncbi:hypothetical protein FRC01_004402 [Tulasnella sp. 417]|nr:hypothetical protein FRC01_004402 [Tulasnella sp. 417]